MTNLQVVVERLVVYSDEDAAGIGRLMPFLSGKFDGTPVSRELLEMIIDSSFHDQIVARFEGRIVGAATMSLIAGAAAGRAGYLEDFVVDLSVRRMGIGGKLWNEMKLWCEERRVDFEFTSHQKRIDAHAFYFANGAHIRQTDVFHVDTTQ